MQTQRIPVASFLAAFAIVLGSVSAPAQTSIGLSGYGAFSGTTTANGTQQSPANQAGGLFELRHISNPIFGFEATYSFNRANQTYTSHPGACPAFGCSLSTETVRSNAHEVTADWTPSVHFANFRPFGVLGVGLLLDVPSENQATVFTQTPSGGSTTTTTSTSSTKTSYKPVYVYGAGLDWGLIPHIGVRLQYRGNLYSAPNVTNLFSSTNTFTHTAEPMVGIYVHF